ncbi:MAG: energy transducer TonB [Chitinophagaceae bacterium]
MNTNQILSADLLDLIFDDRNKEYGAYELRKTYQPRIVKALFITTSIALLAFAGNLLASSKNEQKEKFIVIPYDPVWIEPDEVKPPPLPPPARVEPPPQIHSEQFSTIQMVDQVDEPPPAIDDLRDAKIDVIKVDGDDFTGIATTTDLDRGTNIIEQQKETEPIGPYRVVQVEARFNGNWIKFLERNLNASVPVDNGAPAGNYQVMVQFVVDIDGKVSDIRTLSNAGYGMEQEAIRVLKKAEKWEPAIQNGRQVKAYRRQSIIFQVTEN